MLVQPVCNEDLEVLALSPHFISDANLLTDTNEGSSLGITLLHTCTRGLIAFTLERSVLLEINLGELTGITRHLRNRDFLHEARRADDLRDALSTHAPQDLSIADEVGETLYIKF